MSVTQTYKAAGGTLLMEAAFTANGGVGETIVGSITWDPQQDSTKLVQIPIAETWQIVDLYSISTTDATTNNPQVEFYKDTDRKLDVSKPLGTVVVTSAQRPNGLNADLRYEGGSQMSVRFVALVTNASAATAKCQAAYEKS